MRRTGGRPARRPGGPASRARARSSPCRSRPQGRPRGSPPARRSGRSEDRDGRNGGKERRRSSPRPRSATFSRSLTCPGPPDSATAPFLEPSPGQEPVLARSPGSGSGTFATTATTGRYVSMRSGGLSARSPSGWTWTAGSTLTYSSRPESLTRPGRSSGPFSSPPSASRITRCRRGRSGRCSRGGSGTPGSRPSSPPTASGLWSSPIFSPRASPSRTFSTSWDTLTPARRRSMTGGRGPSAATPLSESASSIPYHKSLRSE